MRLTSKDMRLMRRTETEILDGRKVEPGDFYLERRTWSSTDPHTGEPTYTASEELAQPHVQVLKGDEREIAVGGMELNAGDLIITFEHDKYIPREEPDAVGEFFYERVKYLDEYYLITRVWEKGMGYRANRKIIFASKVK